MARGAANAASGERRRQEILAFVEGFVHERGHSPTVREVASGVGLVSPGATHRQLERLVEDGRLQKVQVTTSRVVYALREPG